MAVIYFVTLQGLLQKFRKYDLIQQFVLNEAPLRNTQKGNS
jgi:hypothetical protein